MKQWLAPCLLGFLLCGTGCALIDDEFHGFQRATLAPTQSPPPFKSQPNYAATPTPPPLPVAPSRIEPTNSPAIPRRLPEGNPIAVRVEATAEPVIVRLPSNQGARESVLAGASESSTNPLTANANGVGTWRATFGAARPAATQAARPISLSGINFGRPGAIETSLPRDLLAYQAGEVPEPLIAPLIVRDRSVPVVILAGMKARVRRPNFLNAPIAKEAAAIVQSDPVPILQIPRASPEILQLDPPDDLPAALLPYVVLQEPAKGIMPPTADALGEPVLQITVIPKAEEPKVRQPALEPPGPIAALPEATAPVRRPYFLDAPIAREVVAIPPSPPVPIIQQPTGPQIVQFESAQDLPAAILPFIVQQDPRSMPGDADSPEEMVPQIMHFPEADEPVPPRANLGPPMRTDP